MSEARDLLRRLAAHDEHTLEATMASGLALDSRDTTIDEALDRRTRVLVRLAALIAVDACTESLRWAVDLASTDGADDDAVAAVLLATGPSAGAAQLVASAPRLAHALCYTLPPGNGPISY